MDRAARYLEKLPPSIQGSGGSGALFRAACSLVKGFALTPEEALPLLHAWNYTHCAPPWSDSELRHKLESAAKSSRTLGYLLDSRESRPGPVGTGAKSGYERGAVQRPPWPEFQTPDRGELETISSLRAIPLDALRLAVDLGYLSGTVHDGHRCFAIRDRAFAQVRRLDGHPFSLRNGDQIKAKNLPGSRGAFLGHRWLGGPEVRVLIVEGAIGLLEAIAAHELADPTEGWAILAATSASSRFAREPDLLRRIAGRRVRIIPDRDSSGCAASASWLADLELAGCPTDVLELPEGIKDIGPLVANPSEHQIHINAIFQ